MAGLALYRKYRSADFSQVIGQDHITQTLLAQLAAGTISHAYLFTGPRGVGKTSVARLLAKALNCRSLVDGITRPCNDCDACLVPLNSSLDIIEIDAASNNSVDDIRELRDKVGIAPSAGQYKVYIIDEVHMLSTGAFNALLKTLEEPPSHAVFILATTEAHKVPATVMSRTQSFAFRPIGTEDISRHLREIAAAEDVQIDDEAISALAEAATGGFRDAISMLDQVRGSSVAGVPLSLADIQRLLGQGDSVGNLALARAIANRDAVTALQQLDTIMAQGGQPGQIIAQQVELWRKMLRLAAGGQAAGPLHELASVMGSTRCAQAIEALVRIIRSPWALASLETVIVGLCLPAAEAVAAPQQVANPIQPSSKRTSKDDSTETVSPGEPPAAKNEGPLEAGRWPKVLVQLKQHHNSLSALLQMYPADFSADAVVIRSRFNFHRDLFNKPQNRQIIEQAAAKVYGRALSVTAITDEVAAAAKPARAKKAANADLTATALEILGGEVID